MKNVTEILKDIGLEIPADKKADFDKVFFENYKTVAELERLTNKLQKANDDLQAVRSERDNLTTKLGDLEKSGASAEEWKKKYTDLVAENNKAEEERKAAELDRNQRAEFDNYFSEQKKEWANPLIGDGYFAKYKSAVADEANKGKTSADILNALTKDDATAFKTVQPQPTLKGAEPIGSDGGGLKLEGSKFF